MRMFAVAGLVASILVSSTVAQDVPQAPTPTKQHQLLEKFGGEWVTEGEMVMGPDQPVIKTNGTESTRSIGGFWCVSEYKGEFQGAPFTGVMTIGYDPKKQKYVGTWVCSMCHDLVEYEGSMDEAGKVLTLNTECTCPTTGKPMKMRDVIEIKDDGRKVLTSYGLGDDGEWAQFMHMTSTRKK